MIHTRLCDLLEIAHPIVLGGMGSATSATLVAAVSTAAAHDAGSSARDSSRQPNHRCISMGRKQQEVNPA